MKNGADCFPVNKIPGDARPTRAEMDAINAANPTPHFPSRHKSLADLVASVLYKRCKQIIEKRKRDAKSKAKKSAYRNRKLGNGSMCSAGRYASGKSRIPQPMSEAEKMIIQTGRII